MLTLVADDSPLRCAQKLQFVNTAPTDRSLFNWTLRCEDGDVAVNALDMVSVSPYMKCSILKYNASEKETVLEFDSGTVNNMMRLLYSGEVQLDGITSLSVLFGCADFLGVDSCVGACLDCLLSRMRDCCFDDLLKVHEFCSRFEDRTGPVQNKLVRVLAEDFHIDKVAADLPHDLLERVAASDDLWIASELVLARALQSAEAWDIMRHVRLEIADNAELACLLKECVPAEVRLLYYQSMLNQEVCARLQHTSSARVQSGGRRPRCQRQVWKFDYMPGEQFEQRLESVSCFVHFNAGRLQLWLDNKGPGGVKVYHSLAFSRIHHKTPSFHEQTNCWLYDFPDLLAPGACSMFICVCTGV